MDTSYLRLTRTSMIRAVSLRCNGTAIPTVLTIRTRHGSCPRPRPCTLTRIGGSLFGFPSLPDFLSRFVFLLAFSLPASPPHRSSRQERLPTTHLSATSHPDRALRLCVDFVGSCSDSEDLSNASDSVSEYDYSAYDSSGSC